MKNTEAMKKKHQTPSLLQKEPFGRWTTTNCLQNIFILRLAFFYKTEKFAQ